MPRGDPWTLDYSDDSTFFPTDQTIKKFSRSFRQVKRFVAAQNKAYMFAAAKATEVLCKGALAGMEGDDEKTKRFNLMRVCIATSADQDKKARECPVGYAPYLQFYHTYLRLEHDPERGYGLFNPLAVAQIELLAAP